MALTPDEVTEFMAARKVVPARTDDDKLRRMTWESPSPERYLCRAPLYVDAVRVGQLTLFINPAFDRSWSFNLSLRGEMVFRWDAKPTPSGHNNPRRGCPEGFERKVRKPEHEHVWVEGLDCDCARDLPDDVDTSSHERMFEEFCKRSNVQIDAEYDQPQPQAVFT